MPCPSTAKLLDAGILGLSTRLNNLAHIYWEEGRLDRAERLYRAALIADRSTYGPTHPEIAVDLYISPSCCAPEGRAGEAREQHAKTAEIARPSF